MPTERKLLVPQQPDENITIINCDGKDVAAIDTNDTPSLGMTTVSSQVLDKTKTVKEYIISVWSMLPTDFKNNNGGNLHCPTFFLKPTVRATPNYAQMGRACAGSTVLMGMTGFDGSGVKW